MRAEGTAEERARDPLRRSCGDRAGGERVARNALHRLPFIARTDRDPAGNCAFAYREHSIREIDRSLAASVERMHRDDADRTSLRMQPDSGYRRVNTAAAQAIRRPHPAQRRIENPTAIVIRQPAPRLITDERQADRRVGKPE